MREDNKVGFASQVERQPLPYYDTLSRVEDLVGMTMTSVTNFDDRELVFVADDGRKYIFYHEQDCCESVLIDDIVGDLSDLVGSPITMAEEVSEGMDEVADKYTEYSMSFTWTFYKFATARGYVTVRWYGSSNGYYSERVDFRRVE